MPIVGIYRELGEGEEVVYESKGAVPIVVVKELEVRKLMGVERKEHPLIYAIAHVYLTNRRLMILALHQLESHELLEHRAPRIATRSGAWLEIPISSISLVDLRSMDVKRDHRLVGFLEWGGFKELVGDRVPAVELIYDDRQASGRVKDYVDVVSSMGILVKDYRKVEKSSDKLLLMGEGMVEEFMPALKSLMGRPIEIKETEEHIVSSEE